MQNNKVDVYLVDTTNTHVVMTYLELFTYVEKNNMITMSVGESEHVFVCANKYHGVIKELMSECCLKQPGQIAHWIMQRLV